MPMGVPYPACPWVYRTRHDLTGVPYPAWPHGCSIPSSETGINTGGERLCATVPGLIGDLAGFWPPFSVCFSLLFLVIPGSNPLKPLINRLKPGREASRVCFTVIPCYSRLFPFLWFTSLTYGDLRGFWAEMWGKVVNSRVEKRRKGSRNPVKSPRVRDSWCRNEQKVCDIGWFSGTRASSRISALSLFHMGFDGKRPSVYPIFPSLTPGRAE